MQAISGNNCYNVKNTWQTIIEIIMQGAKEVLTGPDTIMTVRTCIKRLALNAEKFVRFPSGQPAVNLFFAENVSRIMRDLILDDQKADLLVDPALKIDRCMKLYARIVRIAVLFLSGRVKEEMYFVRVVLKKKEIPGGKDPEGNQEIRLAAEAGNANQIHAAGMIARQCLNL